MKYASLSSRVGAHVIDSAIVNIFLDVINRGLSNFFDVDVDHVVNMGNMTLILWYGAGYWLIAAPYEVLAYCSKYKATIGKRVFGIVVTDLKGERISLIRSVIRFLVTFPSAISGIGYLMAIFTQKKQTMHDLLAGTLVCCKEK